MVICYNSILALLYPKTNKRDPEKRATVCSAFLSFVFHFIRRMNLGMFLLVFLACLFALPLGKQEEQAGVSLSVEELLKTHSRRLDTLQSSLYQLSRQMILQQ